MLDIGPIVKSLLRHKVVPLLMLLQLALSVAIVSNILFFISERVSEVTRPRGFDEDKLGKVSFFRDLTNVNFSQEVFADLEFLRLQEGIDEATVTSGIPMSGSGISSRFKLAPEASDVYPTNILYTDDHAIPTFGFKLVEGRNFLPEEIGIYPEADMPRQMQAIVTQSYAKLISPDASSLGIVLYRSNDAYTIVGVIKDFVGYWPDWEFSHNGMLIASIPRNWAKNLVFRSEEKNLTALVLKTSEQLVDKEAARTLWGEEPVATSTRKQYNSEYSMIKILSVVVVLLVFVNALGIVGLTTFWVNQRRKQIGIRRALGATKMMIMRYFIIENVIIVLSASVLGALIAYTGSGYMVKSYAVDLLPWIYIPCATLVVLILSLAAAIVPVRKATLVSPVEAVSG
jgi:putative ABC transport system permease protein